MVDIIEDALELLKDYKFLDTLEMYDKDDKRYPSIDFEQNYKLSKLNIYLDKNFKIVLLDNDRTIIQVYCGSVSNSRVIHKLDFFDSIYSYYVKAKNNYIDNHKKTIDHYKKRIK